MPESASDAYSDTYQLILDKVPAERQPAAALFLSGCFSLPPASTKGIAAAGPIALLSDLTKNQADAVLAELSPTLPAGAVIRVEVQDEAARIGRLQWPRPPKIYGSLIEDIPTKQPERNDEPHEIKCPFCGGSIELADDFSVVVTKQKRGDTSFRSSAQSPAPTDDNDPLFSGVKPLATGTGKFASIRSLQAGDTGFWMDHASSIFAPSGPEEDEPKSGLAVRVSGGGNTANAGSRSGTGTGTGTGRGRDGTSAAKRTGNRPSAGLAAFMKPGAFAVVVSRTRDAATVKMIAEILGVTDNEARERSLNLGLCVAQGIALDEAQNLLARFRNLGAKARIVKPS